MAEVDRPAVRTKTHIARNKLAQFLPTLELIKAFEGMTLDVGGTLPDAIESTAVKLQEVSASSDFATSIAHAARALAELALELAAASADGPPPVMTVAAIEPDDLVAQVAALREEVVALRALINDRFQGPTP